MSDFVFSSLPVDVDALVAQVEVDAVREVLEGLPDGEWITARTIETLLGWKRQGTSVRVRRAVKELQLVGFPAVESHAGFTIARHVSMVDRCLEKEMMRARGLGRTIGALQRIRDNMLTGQQRLAFHIQPPKGGEMLR